MSAVEQLDRLLYHSSAACTRLGLGPVLFILYVADLAAVISQHGLSPHHCVDGTQIYGSFSPIDVHAFSLKVSECLNTTSPTG